MRRKVDEALVGSIDIMKWKGIDKYNIVNLPCIDVYNRPQGSCEQMREVENRVVQSAHEGVNMLINHGVPRAERR